VGIIAVRTAPTVNETSGGRFLRFFSDGTIDGGFEVRAGCGGEKAGCQASHPTSNHGHSIWLRCLISS